MNLMNNLLLNRFMSLDEGKMNKIIENKRHLSHFS